MAAALLAGFALRPVIAQEHVHRQYPQRSITLEEVIEQIESANPALRAARLEADALGRVPDQVSAWPDPSISVGYQPFPILTAHGAQRSQWTIEQIIPYPGKLGLREDIAGLDARAVVHESEALLEDLILQAKEAYYDLYRLGHLEALIDNFEAELQQFEEAVAIRYEVGSGQQQALLKAQLERNQLTQRLHHVEGARRRAAATLARLTNDPEGPDYYLAADPTPPNAVGLEPTRLTEVALAQRPEIAALEAAAEQADREIDLARMDGYPDVGLRITYFDIAGRDVPASAGGRDALAIGASVRIPLQRSRIRASVDEARLHRSRIEAQQEALRAHYRTQIDELVAAIEHESRSIDEFDSILLPQAASMVEAATNAYSTGSASFLDLLDAERTLFSLRTGYIDAVNRLLVASAHLERTLGVRALGDSYTLTENEQGQ